LKELIIAKGENKKLISIIFAIPTVKIL